MQRISPKYVFCCHIDSCYNRHWIIVLIVQSLGRYKELYKKITKQIVFLFVVMVFGHNVHNICMSICICFISICIFILIFCIFIFCIFIFCIAGCADKHVPEQTCSRLSLHRLDTARRKWDSQQSIDQD